MAPELVQVPSNRLDALASAGAAPRRSGPGPRHRVARRRARRDASRSRSAGVARRGHRPAHRRQRERRHRGAACNASSGSSARWPREPRRRPWRRHPCHAIRRPAVRHSAAELAPAPRRRAPRRPSRHPRPSRRLAPEPAPPSSPSSAPGSRRPARRRSCSRCVSRRRGDRHHDHRRRVGEHDPPGAAGHGAGRVRAGRVRSQHRVDADAVRAERRPSCQVRGTAIDRRVGARCVRRRAGRRRVRRRRRRRPGQRCRVSIASGRRHVGDGPVDVSAGPGRLAGS